MSEDLAFRKRLARQLLSAGAGPGDRSDASRELTAAAAGLDIPFPPGLAPVPQAIDPAPAPDDPLPAADVVVVTWTVDETDALAHVLTPGVTRDRWYPYARDFEQYLPKIRKGAPARSAGRLASYRPVTVGGKRVLCVKSELHLNQDGVQTPPVGSPHNASLPVRDLFDQIIEETGAGLVITTGTAGAVFAEHDLGDVVVTRAAQFRVAQEFRDAPFAGAKYVSDWPVPTAQLDTAVGLMGRFKDQLVEPEFLPPTVNFAPLDHLPEPIRPNDPDIKLDGRDMPAFHPILTTDYFEFGTSVNRLDRFGAAVEMGDAVLGLVVEDRKAAGRPAPDWLVVRNCSDPQINGALRDKPAKQSLQATWAVYYYQGFGYWTSVNSALATWGVIAGLA